MSNEYWCVLKPEKPRQKGQGVIEYAGALVIAAVLVSLAMFIVPENVASLIDNIVTASVNFFMQSLPS